MYNTVLISSPQKLANESAQRRYIHFVFSIDFSFYIFKPTYARYLVFFIVSDLSVIPDDDDVCVLGQACVVKPLIQSLQK